MGSGGGERPAKEASAAEVEAAALDFLRTSWDILETMHIVPRPEHQLLAKVGVDWFFPDIQDSASAIRMSEALTAYLNHYDTTMHNSHLAWGPARLMISLIEQAIAYTGLAEREKAFTQATSDLLSVLREGEYTLVSYWIVSHIKTFDLRQLGGRGVQIQPLNPNGRLLIQDHLDISGVGRRELQIPTGAPVSVLSLTKTVCGDDDPFELQTQMEAELERHLLLLRLFRPTSAHLLARVRGSIEPCSTVPTTVDTEEGPFDLFGIIPEAETTAEVDDDTIEHFNRFMSDFLKVWSPAVSAWQEDDMALTAPHTGLVMFNRSFGVGDWQEAIPLLISCLEGWMLPDAEKDAVIARLKTRICLLLQTSAESCERLYSDIGVLYDLRSKIQHAANSKAKAVRKNMRRVAQSETDLEGVEQACAIAALRELARRVVVARILLASSEPELWNLTDIQPIDPRLLSQEFRDECRGRLDTASEEMNLDLFGP